MIGARVGNWYLESEIGRGSQGTVYAARGFDDAGRKAAVKVLADPRTRDPGFLHRFPADMLALQRLNHPNIVHYYDCGTHAGQAWYAAELVDGADLARLLEGGRRPWREVFAIAVQAARALRHGHLRSTLHRDLKPAHFLLAADGTLKLTEFGVAKFVPQPPASATPVMGSAAYLPPESAGGKPLTRRSDFYSLGGVFYTLVTGRPPFAAASVVELIHRQCYALPERPGLLVPDLPSEFDELICALLDKNPTRRPASAAALLDDLDRIRGKLERKGDKLALPADPGTGVMEPLVEGNGVSDEVDDDARPELGRRRVRFAAVLVLFLVTVGALVSAFAWPGPSAQSLYESARPLLDSDDPAAWDRAWDEYLEPLARKYPDRYKEEVASAKARIQDHREQRRALAAGAKVEPATDAERFYLRGLRLAQAGDPDAARSTWKNAVAVFGDVEADKRWVDLARDGLIVLDKANSRTVAPTDRRPFQQALDRARHLLAEGKESEAMAAFASLEALYRDDANALAAIRGANPR